MSGQLFAHGGKRRKMIPPSADRKHDRYSDGAGDHIRRTRRSLAEDGYFVADAR